MCPVCRPQQKQRIIYRGHKRIHAIKFQSVAAPNGLIAMFDGPYEERKHGSGVLADSGLLTKLKTFLLINTTNHSVYIVTTSFKSSLTGTF